MGSRSNLSAQKENPLKPPKIEKIKEQGAHEVYNTWPAPYLVTGILDKEHYCLRSGYAALVRPAEVLAARPEVDPARIRVEGGSQGGGPHDDVTPAAGVFWAYKAVPGTNKTIVVSPHAGH